MTDVEVDALGIARRLRARDGNAWLPPQDGPFGGGWVFARRDRSLVMIVSAGPSAESLLGESRDFTPWLHASIVRRDRIADYDDLVLMHRAVWGDDGWAYQCFAPLSTHVNLHPGALHLWGKMDGSAVLPNFGAAGTI